MHFWGIFFLLGIIALAGWFAWRWQQGKTRISNIGVGVELSAFQPPTFVWWEHNGVIQATTLTIYIAWACHRYWARKVVGREIYLKSPKLIACFTDNERNRQQLAGACVGGQEDFARLAEKYANIRAEMYVFFSAAEIMSAQTIAVLQLEKLEELIQLQ